MSVHNTRECGSGSLLAGDTAHQQLSVNDEPDSRWVQDLNASLQDPGRQERSPPRFEVHFVPVTLIDVRTKLDLPSY